jgi:hypothetical protein
MKEKEVKKRVLEITKNPNGKTEVRVVPCKLMDIAHFYNMSFGTMRRKIKMMEKEIGKRSGQFFTIAQVTVILQELGIPKWVEIE